jgi:hypothetical protein
VSGVDSMRVELEKLAAGYDGQRWFKWILSAVQSGTPDEVVEAIDTGIRGAKILHYGGPVFDLLDANPGQAFDALMDFLGWLATDPKRLETRALFLAMPGADELEDDEDGSDDSGAAVSADDLAEDDDDDNDGDGHIVVAGDAVQADGGYIAVGTRPSRSASSGDEDDDEDDEDGDEDGDEDDDDGAESGE